MENITIAIASQIHLKYLVDIEAAFIEAASQKGNGIAIRDRAYLRIKILEGKSIIAHGDDGKWAGFCYIESWGHNRFVANSGLIVSSEFRGLGLASKIKEKALELSGKLFPGAKLFGLTTNLAVMKINSELGYNPVTFSELTDDNEFWKGCESCSYYDILVRTARTHCLCTAMLMDPDKKKKVNGKKHASVKAAVVKPS